MAKTIDELKAQSAEVKDATVVGENTATRVGTLFNDIVEHIEQAHADGTVTTEKLASSAITTEKIANGAVTFEKLADTLTANKVDNDNKIPINSAVLGALGYRVKLLDGVFVPAEKLEPISISSFSSNTILNASGNTITFNNFVVSELIDISNISYDYYYNPTVSVNENFGKIAFYNSNQMPICVISGGNLSNSFNNTIYKLNVPLDAKYIRICAQSASLIKIYRAKKVHSLNELNLASKDMEAVGGINLYNWRTITTDLYINAESGKIVSKSNYFVSDYIYIGDKDASTKITFSNSAAATDASYALYDSEKNIISYGLYNSAGVIKGNAAYLRVSSSWGNWAYGRYTTEKEMVCVGEQPNVFVPYTKTDINSLYKVDDKRWFEQVDLPIISSMKIIETTYEDGIFGGNTGANFGTSDFIQLDPTIKNYYYKCVSSWSATLVKVRFYDKDKNLILNGNLPSGFFNENRNTFLKVVIPNGCQYIRYARVITHTADGLYQSVTQDYETALKGFVDGLVKRVYAPTNNVLWIGTSIPEGAQYPVMSCQANGYVCTNNALGSSSLAIRTNLPRCLTYTEAEFRAAFKASIGTTITQAEFDQAIRKTYEISVLPFVKGESKTINGWTSNPNAIKVSAIVIDHGYNDYANINSLMENKDSIDWDSTDRTNFVGAFNYLINEIQKINPTIKIIIGGYFDYTLVSSNKPLGKNICDLQTLLAQRYNFELLDVWNYSQISWARFVQGTSDYIDKINKQYGKSFTVESWEKDSDGNLRSHKIYCPDGIHPHSDPTGVSNRILNAVYTKLMRNII